MKSMKRFTCGCLSAAVMFTSLAIAPVNTYAAAVKLNQTSAELTVGKKLTLKVQNAKKGVKVKWSSSKKAVAAVSQKGVVTAKAAGSATIKAVVKKTTLKCNVTVVEGAAPSEDSKDITALLAGRSYKGTAAGIEAMNLKFGEDGTVTGAKMDEANPTMPTLKEFSGTYQAVLTGKKVTITVKANGETISYELTVESDDFSKLSATVSVGGLEIPVAVEEVKE